MINVPKHNDINKMIENDTVPGFEHEMMPLHKDRWGISHWWMWVTGSKYGLKCQFGKLLPISEKSL
jgi:hypothetical protein